MNNKFLIALATLLLFVAACGGKEKSTDSLVDKKAELDKILTEIAALQTKANQLQTAIAAADPAAAAKGKDVEVDTVSSTVFKSYLTIEGKADADKSTIATAKAPGVITGVYASAGQYVSAGQVLARLDANAIQQQKAPIQQQLSLAKTLMEKQQRLYNQGIGTEVQLLQAKTQVDALKKQLNAIDAQVAMYAIYAPINGTIESVDVKIGQAVSPGMPSFKVVNLSRLKIIADVSESYSAKINRGDEVEVFLKDIDKTIKARVSFASKIIDPLNRTFRIEVQIPSSSNIKPNMIATVKIVDYENKAALAVPINAVQTTEEGSFVMVAEKQGNTFIAKKVSVTTGKGNSESMEILSGLNPGDLLITVGAQDINEGQVIKF